MLELEFHRWAIFIQLALAVFALLGVLLIIAPYGRHERAGWGPTLPCVFGWVVMELPAVLVFTFFFFTGDHSSDLVPLIFLGMWQVHYLNRTVVFPFRMRSGGRRMPILIPLLAVIFNTLNSYTNALWVGHLGTYDAGWLLDPRFLFGAGLFFVGWIGNCYSDSILRKLRTPGESGYKIPKDGLYRWVSAPNYLCEILEWIGWAIATWSLAGVAFAVFTAANLVPRAFDHHRWYRQQFPEYPSKRKALIPYIF